MIRKKTGSLALLLIVLSAVLAAPAKAEPGLDPGFGTDGIVQIGEGSEYGLARAIADSASGHIFVAITGRGGGPGWLAKLDPEGQLDTTFGTDGIVALEFGGMRIKPTDLATDQSGRVVVSGNARSGNSEKRLGAVARIESDGTIDFDFGSAGLALLPRKPGASPQDLFFTSGARIVTAGTASRGRVFVARLRSKGILDRSFSNDGYRFVSVGRKHRLVNVAVDRQRRIVLGASTFKVTVPGTRTGEWNLGFARLDPDGAFDRTFSGGGKALVNASLDEDDEYADLTDLTLDRHGRVLASSVVSGLSGTVVRLTRRGKLDGSFAEKGRIRSAWSHPSSISVDRKGRILVLKSEVLEGFEGGSNDPQPSGEVQRFAPDGKLDRRFGYGRFANALGDHVLDSRGGIVALAYFGRGEADGVIRVLNP